MIWYDLIRYDMIWYDMIYNIFMYLEPQWLYFWRSTPQTRPFPIKTRVIWVLGIYIYIDSGYCLIRQKLKSRKLNFSTRRAPKIVIHGVITTFKWPAIHGFHSFCFTPKYVGKHSWNRENLWLETEFLNPVIPGGGRYVRRAQVGPGWPAMMSPPRGTEFHPGVWFHFQVVYHKAARDWANDTLWLLRRHDEGRWAACVVEKNGRIIPSVSHGCPGTEVKDQMVRISGLVITPRNTPFISRWNNPFTNHWS